MFDRFTVQEFQFDETTEIMTTTGEEVCLPTTVDVLVWHYADGATYGDARLSNVQLGGLQLLRDQIEQAFEEGSISAIENAAAETAMNEDAPRMRTFASFGGVA